MTVVNVKDKTARKGNGFIIGRLLIVSAIVVFSIVVFSNRAVAGLDTRIAASFAAKYQVCALKLKDTLGYRFKALGLKAKSDQIGRDKIGGGGYIETFLAEKKKAWALPLKKCKKFADNI